MKGSELHHLAIKFVDEHQGLGIKVLFGREADEIIKANGLDDGDAHVFLMLVKGVVDETVFQRYDNALERY